ncbi:MAG: rhomboid family intramembrane serine protease [Parvularculaceae bacterium]
MDSSVRGRSPFVSPGPYRGVFNVPPVVAITAVFISAFYFLGEIAPHFTVRLLGDRVGLSPALLFAGPAANGGWPRLVAPVFTHMLVHAGLAHLLFNMLWLIVFGSPVAQRLQSAWRFLALFLLSGAAGGLFFAALNPHDLAPLVGASGGVTGLLGAMVRFAFRQPGRFPAGDFSRLRLTDPTVVSWSLVVILLNVSVLVLGPGMGLGDERVAWQAHIGGYLFGLIFFPFFDRPGRAPH